jgi:hypothetical protein
MWVSIIAVLLDNLAEGVGQVGLIL